MEALGAVLYFSSFFVVPLFWLYSLFKALEFLFFFIEKHYCLKRWPTPWRKKYVEEYDAGRFLAVVALNCFALLLLP